VRTAFCLCGLVVACVVPARAVASTIVGAAATRQASLKVNAAGVALVEFRQPGTGVRHVMVWGAINALPHPTDSSAVQQAFKLDYSGGWKSRHDSDYWRRFRNVCGAYDGPALPLLVAACKAPDGSYWALQMWQRNLPMRGFAPWTAVQRENEVHVSHWTGALPVLEVYRHWTYGRTKQGFFGRLTYDGQPVYGTRSPSARVGDHWARNVYIDSFNSSYGKGWRHDTAITTHVRSGGFCYTFVAQRPPKGYPSVKANGNGLGAKYRVTVMGPGVTPIVRWEGDRLGNYDPAKDTQINQTFDGMLAGDQKCAAER
jgi:hypothetical protein